MPKPRPGTFAGDDERVAIGRRHRLHTPNGGVPVEVDPEETPAPQLPPAPDVDHDEGVTERLARLELGQQRLAGGVDQVWDSRHTKQRLDDLGVIVARIDEAVIGMIKPTVTAVKVELESMQRSRAAEQSDAQRNQARVQLFWDQQWPNAIKQLDGLGERLGRIERAQEDQGREIKALGAQVSSSLAVGHSLDVRVTALERVNADGALVATTNKRWTAVIISGVSAAIALVVANVKTIAGWFH